MVAAFLEHRVNAGYEHSENAVVVEVNGRSISGLDEFVAIATGTDGPWVEIVTLRPFPTVPVRELASTAGLPPGMPRP